ncbi:hypothetical protein CAEBREN_21748 [Caenorhabditis brenneri]|uniref:USP domain-containing protein n=1 Tax=Caenorhabditis brenneri TaxID=135651 RepID=G0N1F7_CAEBE|nr:hypothetical protein CAEBREN_21748 [Caenorhabditis brenneri]
MVHPICRGLSKQNVIKSSSARTSRFPKRTNQTTLPKSRISTPGLEDRPLLLENQDNTLCYLNSALNILYMVKEVRKFFATQEIGENSILKDLDMGEGAQSCHEVLKKIGEILPPSLQNSLSLTHQKLSCCKKCGESSTPKKSIKAIEILLPEEGCLTLQELLSQDLKGTCSKCNYPIEIFHDYQVTEDTKTIFVSVLQADPMPIRDFGPDRIWNLFGARWVLKGAVIYLPDSSPDIDYGENGHSISWTQHMGKWCKVSDQEMEVYDKFDASDADIEMMVFERVPRRN